MSRLRFRTLAHTADVRLQAWGANEAELLLNVVLGAQAVALGRPPRDAPTTWVDIGRWPKGTDRRAVRAANEALFHLFTHRRATVDLVAGRSGARLGLAPLPPGQHLECEIKAATFHALRPTRDANRLSLVLTLDL